MVFKQYLVCWYDGFTIHDCITLLWICVLANWKNKLPNCFSDSRFFYVLNWMGGLYFLLFIFYGWVIFLFKTKKILGYHRRTVCCKHHCADIDFYTISKHNELAGINNSINSPIQIKNLSTYSGYTWNSFAYQ